MTQPRCQQTREEAAIAVLRGEPLDERTRAHHHTCRECREEDARLAALSPLLSIARDETLPAPGQPDEALLRRTLDELARRRQRQHRRRAWALAAAAAVIMAVAAPGGYWFAARRDTSHSAGADVVVADGIAQSAASPVGAKVEVRDAAPGHGGLVVIHGWGVSGGTTCRIELTDSHGWTQTISTWTAPSGSTGDWQATVAVSVAPKEVRDVRLVDDATNTVLVTIPVKQV